MPTVVHIERITSNRTIIAGIDGTLGLDLYSKHHAETRPNLRHNSATLTLRDAVEQIPGVERMEVVKTLFCEHDRRNVIVFAEIPGGDLASIEEAFVACLKQQFPDAVIADRG